MILSSTSCQKQQIALACTLASIAIPAAIKAVKFKYDNPEASLCRCIAKASKKAAILASISLQELIKFIEKNESKEIQEGMSLLKNTVLGKNSTPLQLVLLSIAMNNLSKASTLENASGHHLIGRSFKLPSPQGLKIAAAAA